MKGMTKAMLAALVVMLAGAVAAGEWTLETVQDPATYQAVAVLQQASAGHISDEYGMKEVHPALEIRCTPGGDGSLSVRIDWQRFISSFNTEVTFAADDKDAMTVKLGVDRSNKITHTRDAADDDALLAYLEGASALAVTVTPYSEVPVTVDYDLAGFAAELARLKETCNP